MMKFFGKFSDLIYISRIKLICRNFQNLCQFCVKGARGRSGIYGLSRTARDRIRLPEHDQDTEQLRPNVETDV